jgi:hypothetical protein
MTVLVTPKRILPIMLEKRTLCGLAETTDKTNTEKCCSCYKPTRSKRAQKEGKEAQEPALEQTMYCGRCKLTTYCSRECQNQDWKKHRAVCKIASKYPLGVCRVFHPRVDFFY